MSHREFLPIWESLEEVPDPEIPGISIVDLGIVREIEWCDDALTVTITPTYCGCPAMATIVQDVRTAIRRLGISELRIETRLAPAWTTDWMSERGKVALRQHGIAPPVRTTIPASALGRRAPLQPSKCPRCGSTDTSCISAFGSTLCKALFRCNGCLEPFDQFKSH
ncbi:phenylacetate-CoA oxygenase subunit PaaJ [Pendulispora rubella]|uniref:Phenylacetate-CoA oxygenase subunit PaaJ n=1 Tax=Pendulispora rubella TaxID=2741070 RepID=A0ABZ2LBT9_9BACT